MLNGDEVCTVCDGGPGNSCACSCGLRQYVARPRTVTIDDPDNGGSEPGSWAREIKRREEMGMSEFIIGHGSALASSGPAFGQAPVVARVTGVASITAFDTLPSASDEERTCEPRTVRLIAVSQPVIDDVPGPTELLAFCARVSSTANQMKHETGGKLLRFLVQRKEWSPLEMVSLTMEIETTRDIARQILRHRSFSFQEFSQRYAVVDDAPVLREARLQDTKDRQNSLATDDRVLATQWEGVQLQAADAARSAYNWALSNGIAKEVARAVLPEGMTASRLYMAGTLRSWIHYIGLRADPKTQKEHRLIAEQCRGILIEQFPDLADVIGG